MLREMFLSVEADKTGIESLLIGEVFQIDY